MAPRPDWNLRMVRSREAKQLLPKLPGTPEQVDWRGRRVGHLDMGFTEHRCSVTGRPAPCGCAPRMD